MEPVPGVSILMVKLNAMARFARALRWTVPVVALGLAVGARAGQPIDPTLSPGVTGHARIIQFLHTVTADDLGKPLHTSKAVP